MLLVIEDNEISRRRLIRKLAISGFLAHAVSQGQAALESLEKGIYSLVLLDVSTPGLAGLKTTQLIRKKEVETGRQPVPVIAITDLSEREVMTRAGVDDCPDRPVVVEQLTAMIDRFLPGGAAGKILDRIVPCVGKVIKDVRQRRGLSGGELGRIAGVEPEKIALIESGREEALSVVTLIKLAEGLCIQTSDLVEAAERQIAGGADAAD